VEIYLVRLVTLLLGSADRKYRFGTVALTLQLVPILSMFFLLSTACGSALWVAKLEEQKKLVAAGAVPAPREGLGTDEEAPPTYTDNPI
jgi:Flp pilus assembly protein protease CpaA